MTALIVDDSEIFRTALAQGLRARCPGLQVVEAGTAAEGTALARELRPLAVFMDIHLPDGNGLEVARSVKNLFPDTAILVSTAGDLPEYRQAAAELGALEYARKSELGTLLDRFAAHLGRKAGLAA